jgi:hypothetical protein
MDSVDCQEVLQGYLYGIVSVLVSHVSFSTSFGQQPHSWHVHWLLSVQFVNNVHAQMPMMFHLLSQSQYTLMCGRCLPGWHSTYHCYHAKVSTSLLLASRDKREHVTTFHDIWSQHSTAVNCVSWNVIVCVMISSWWFICQFQNFGLRQLYYTTAISITCRQHLSTIWLVL